VGIENDTTGMFLWVLLPASFLAALFFVSQGAIQNVRPYTSATVVEPQVVETKNADGTTRKDTVHTQVIAGAGRFSPASAEFQLPEWPRPAG
jgi:K+-transporting ATPase ATPase A chain